MARLTQFSGAQSSEQSVLDKDTKTQLADIEKAFSSKTKQLVTKLLERVADVDPKPHPNLHKIEA